MTTGDNGSISQQYWSERGRAGLEAALAPGTTVQARLPGALGGRQFREGVQPVLAPQERPRSDDWDVKLISLGSALFSPW